MNDDKLTAWCVIWVAKHNSYPSITANIADLTLATAQANEWKKKGARILAICKESHLAKLVSLMTLCRELDTDMDGVRCPGTAAAILNAIRRIVKD